MPMDGVDFESYLEEKEKEIVDYIAQFTNKKMLSAHFLQGNIGNYFKSIQQDINYHIYTTLQSKGYTISQLEQLEEEILKDLKRNPFHLKEVSVVDGAIERLEILEEKSIDYVNLKEKLSNIERMTGCDGLEQKDPSQLQSLRYQMKRNKKECLELLSCLVKSLDSSQCEKDYKKCFDNKGSTSIKREIRNFKITYKKYIQDVAYVKTLRKLLNESFEYSKNFIQIYRTHLSSQEKTQTHHTKRTLSQVLTSKLENIAEIQITMETGNCVKFSREEILNEIGFEYTAKLEQWLSKKCKI